VREGLEVFPGIKEESNQKESDVDKEKETKQGFKD